MAKLIINSIDKFIKRIIDVIGGAIGLIFLIPITLCIIIAKIILNEKGPVFYSQKRIGKKGKMFRIYKFRSMIVDADKKLKTILKEDKELKEEYRKYKKLHNDPRITKIGKFIRKSNIDEMPQFINVLIGNMSLVGPRPYLKAEKKDMKNYYKHIITCKPGITGIWQVNQKSNRLFVERLELDYKYVKEHNILIDAKILFETVIMMFKNK